MTKNRSLALLTPLLVLTPAWVVAQNTAMTPMQPITAPATISAPTPAPAGAVPADILAVAGYPDNVLDALLRLSGQPAFLDALLANPDQFEKLANEAAPEVRGALNQLGSAAELTYLVADERDNFSALASARAADPRAFREEIQRIRASREAARLAAARDWQESLAADPAALAAYGDLLTRFVNQRRSEFPEFAAVAVTDQRYYYALPPHAELMEFASTDSDSAAIFPVMERFWNRHAPELSDALIESGQIVSAPRGGAPLLAAAGPSSRSDMWKPLSDAPSSVGLAPVIQQPPADQPQEAVLASAVLESLRRWRPVDPAQDAAAREEIAAQPQPDYNPAPGEIDESYITYPQDTAPAIVDTDNDGLYDMTPVGEPVFEEYYDDGVVVRHYPDVVEAPEVVYVDPGYDDIDVTYIDTGPSFGYFGASFYSPFYTPYYFGGWYGSRCYDYVSPYRYGGGFFGRYHHHNYYRRGSSLNIGVSFGNNRYYGHGGRHYYGASRYGSPVYSRSSRSIGGAYKRPTVVNPRPIGGIGSFRTTPYRNNAVTPRVTHPRTTFPRSGSRVAPGSGSRVSPSVAPRSGSTVRPRSSSSNSPRRTTHPGATSLNSLRSSGPVRSFAPQTGGSARTVTPRSSSATRSIAPRSSGSRTVAPRSSGARTIQKRPTSGSRGSSAVRSRSGSSSSPRSSVSRARSAPRSSASRSRSSSGPRSSVSRSRGSSGGKSVIKRSTGGSRSSASKSRSGSRSSGSRSSRAGSRSRPR